MTPDAKIQPAITGRARKTVAYDFSRHGHALVTLYVQFLPMLISQNLTAEFMRKVYADLETCLPMVEADRVLFRHLVMFLTVFFHWMYKMKYSFYQESSVIMSGFFIGFLVEKCAACQSHRESESNDIVFVFHLA